MADLYVRSTDGSDADNGTTWALAKATLSGAAAIDAAGDTIWVSQFHSESSATGQNIALAGTLTSPVKVLCGNDATEPPTSLATGAVITTTGTSSISILGSGYIYGLTFNVGTGTSGTSFAITSADLNSLLIDSCNINILTTATSSSITCGSSSSNTESHGKFVNCQLKFSNASQRVIAYHAKTEFVGGGIASGSTSPNYIIAAMDVCNISFKNFDLSNASSSISLCASGVPASGVPASGRIDFINCKLPSNWSGGVVTHTPLNYGFRASMYNCDSTNANYRLWIETAVGSIKTETTLVKSGGASDGTTALSWKMTTNSSTNEIFPLISDDVIVWCDTTGVSKTITIDILHDNVTALTDAEVWIEIDYLGTTGFPLGVSASDHRSTLLTTAANQTTSAATWTTTGMTTPNKQKLEVTFTPQMKGFVYARIYLAKASYTIYADYDPVIT